MIGNLVLRLLFSPCDIIFIQCDSCFAMNLLLYFNHFTTFCMYRISILLCACMPENVCSCACALVLFACVRGCRCVRVCVGDICVVRCIVCVYRWPRV